MNREILFRGKRIDNGEWVYGDLETGKLYGEQTAAWIGETWYETGSQYEPSGWDNCGYEVDPATVGQYTGLKDKNGKRIFEGDIVEGVDFDAEDGYGVVEWYDGAFEVTNGAWLGTFHQNYHGTDFEVIGNIHDNPELIGGTK